jgi:hypothetical protein
VTKSTGSAWHVFAIGATALFLTSLAALVLTALLRGGWGQRLSAPGLRLVVLGCLWFFLGLAPVLPFAHNYAKYNLAVGLVGIAVTVAGVAVTAKSIGPQLVLLAASMFLLVSIAGVNGPGGATTTDEVSSSASTSYAASVTMSSFEKQHPGPLHVYIDSNTSHIRWTLGGKNLALLIAPYAGTNVCYATVCSFPSTLRLHYDAKTGAITVST